MLKLAQIARARAEEEHKRRLPSQLQFLGVERGVVVWVERGVETRKLY